MKYCISIVLCLVLPFALFAQGQVSGLVIDSKTKQAVPFTSFKIKNQETNKILGNKSKLDGQFKLVKIPFGIYTATLSSVGYQDKIIRDIRISQYNRKLKLGKISLVKKNTKLGTVVIENVKKSIEIQADKKVFNVEKNIAAEGGTLEDVLRNVPSVTLGADGSVSLRGKSNVTILVDGKQNPLFADLETALQSIPAENIKSIEVITNPSAKYEAQGLGGIINIVMKEGKRKKGLSGSVNVGAKYNWRANAGLNVNYRPSEKIALFLNANGGLGNVQEENVYRRTSSESADSYISDALKLRQPKRSFASFGIEYAINKRNKLIWTNSAFRGSFDGNDYNEIFITDDNGQLSEFWTRRNIYNAKPSNTTTNLKYLRTFDNKRQKLNVEANFSKRTYIRESDYQTDIFDGVNNKINSFLQRNPINGGNLNGAFQIDYEHPIGKESKIEIGERTYLMDFSSENFPTIQFENQAEQLESLLKNDFDFLQQVHGAYVNYVTKYKSFSLQLGLRGEYFSYQGTAAQLGTGTFSTDYLSLFPSAFLTKKIDKTSDLSVSYSRRVNRPSFFQLLPFIRVNSPLDTSIGNPSLQPEFINAFEVSYNKTYARNSTFLISAYYQLTDNIIQRFRRFNPDGSTFSQTQNLARGGTLGIEITNQYVVRKGWDITLNANGFRNVILGNEVSDNQDFEGYGGFVKVINNTSIGKKWQLQISGNYYAPKVIVQGTRNGYGFMDLAIKRSFLDKQLNLTLMASDVLNSNQTLTTFTVDPNQVQTTLRNRQTQFIGFNLSYRFPQKGKTSFGRGKKKTETKKRDDNLKDGEGGGY